MSFVVPLLLMVIFYHEMRGQRRSCQIQTEDLCFGKVHPDIRVAVSRDLTRTD